MKCSNIDKLEEILKDDFCIDISTDGVKKCTNKKGFVVNLFDSKTVTFQGKADTALKEIITLKVDAINELEKSIE